MNTVIRWAIIFFVLALIAALLGFGGIANVGIDIAQILFFVFLVIAVITVVAGVFRR